MEGADSLWYSRSESTFHQIASSSAAGSIARAQRSDPGGGAGASGMDENSRFSNQLSPCGSKNNT